MSLSYSLSVVWIGFFSIALPLWAVLLCAVLILIAVWFFLRFTLKILLFFLLFFTLLFILDWLGVFSWVNQNIVSQFL